MQRVPHTASTTSALNVTAVIDTFEQLDIDGPRVLALAGITEEELHGPNARIPAGHEIKFWEALAEHTGDRLVGLRVAEKIQVGSLGAYEYLLRNSPSLRAAVEQGAKFARVIDDLTRITIVEPDQHTAAVRHERVDASPQATFAVECLFAAILRLVKPLLPNDSLLGVRFTHAPNGELSAYQAHFGCPVAFASEYNEIVIRRSLLDMHVQAADPALSRVLEQHVTQMLQQLPAEDAFVQRARSVLGQALQRNSDISLEQLAQTLHMSERTLRRRLEEHGTSYKNLLDELRRELACHYITRTNQSFEETGARLGFADISAFYRAFKRWTSTTPAAYRAQARGRSG